MTTYEAIITNVSNVQRRSFVNAEYVTPADSAEILDRERLENLLRERGFEDSLIPGIVNRVSHQNLQPLVLALVTCGVFPGVKDKQEHRNFSSKLNGKTLPLNKEQLGDFSENPDSLSKAQHKFWPYKFSKNMHENLEPLHDDTVLPFTHEIRRKELEGAFGTIWESKIDPTLQEFFHSPQGEVVVIRKELTRNEMMEKTEDEYRERVEKERRCLVMLRRLEHENIIPLLGCYIHKNAASFLFPRLDMDLDHLLENDRPTQFLADFTLYAALRGLASALSSMHQLTIEKDPANNKDEFIGYHHDLRPVNILVGPAKGTDTAHDPAKDVIWTFHLADFGLSNVKRGREPSKILWKGNNGNYQGPEAKDESLVGRALDVWAFGCLMTELAVYIKDGPKGVERFRAAKSIQAAGGPDKKFHNGEDVKPQVEEYLASLELDSKSSRPNLLVDLAQLARRCLKMAPDLRPKMTEVLDELSKISLKACFDHVLDALPKDSPAGLSDSQYQDHIAQIKNWGSKEGLAPGSAVPPSITLGHEVHKTIMGNMTSLIRGLRATESTGGSMSEAIKSFVIKTGGGSSNIRSVSTVPGAKQRAGAEPETLPEASVYVVGSLNVDIIQRMETLPAPGSHFAVGDTLERLGGHGFNQAIACARLSSRKSDSSSSGRPNQSIGNSVESEVCMEPYRVKLHVCMVGIAGNDGHGQRFHKALNGHSINIKHVHLEEVGTGEARIDLDSKGEFSVRTYAKANEKLNKDRLPPEFPRVTDLILIQVETPIDTARETIKRANKAAVSVVLNLAPLPKEPNKIPKDLYDVDHLIMNAATAYGMKADKENGNSRTQADASNVNDAHCDERCWSEYMGDCWRFAAMGARVVIITLGHRGAVALRMKKKGGEAEPGNMVVERVYVAAKRRRGLPCKDTTGASDAFIGAYVVELLRQKKSGEEENINAALNAGVKAGGMSICSLGSADSIPWGDQIADPDDFEWVSNVQSIV